MGQSRLHNLVPCTCMQCLVLVHCSVNVGRRISYFLALCKEIVQLCRCITLQLSVILFIQETVKDHEDTGADR